jgi:hypothetical protein
VLYALVVGRIAKRATRVRTKKEFPERAHSESKPVFRTGAVHSWSLEDIYSARRDQLSGHNFARPARMAESMLTDDAIFVAIQNRLAPIQCISVAMLACAQTSRAKKVADEASDLYGEGGRCLSLQTLVDVNRALVNHGVAFTRNTPTYREDGSRVDLSVTHWPNEFTRWDDIQKCWFTRACGEDNASVEVPIVHGDGTWTIYQRGETDPWKSGALLAGSMVWARHAFAARDWAKGSASHGNAKVVGELPEGVRLQDPETGALSSEATAFAELLKALVADEMPVGIRPSGSKTEYINNTSSAWQVWSELMAGAEKAAARIYLGTDGILGSQGGAPGVDVQALFGVATTLVQGDLKAITRGIQEGIIEPWTAINFGDSSLAPLRVYQIPDSDADADVESKTKRRQAFYADIEKARELGFEITQTFVDDVAILHNVDAPALAAIGASVPTVALAPADVARVITKNEARAAQGLQPLPELDGQFVVTDPVPAAIVPVDPVPSASRTDEALSRFAYAMMSRMNEIERSVLAIPKPEFDLSSIVTRLVELSASIEYARSSTAERFDRVTSSIASLKLVAEPDHELRSKLAAIETTTNALTLEMRRIADVKQPFSERSAAFLGDVKEYRQRGFVIDDETIATLAKLHDVPTPKGAR